MWTARTIGVAGAELAAHVARPPGADRCPVVLLLPALGAPIVDAGTERLVAGLIDAGIAAMRVEVPAALGLDGKIEAYRGALRSMGEDPLASNAFLFGHSLGGVLAPFVARASPLAGIAVYGAPSRPWCEALCDGANRQLALAGLELDQVQREARLATELYRLLLREGRSPAEALALHPDLAACVAARDLHGEELFGSSLELHRALDALDLGAAWCEVHAPVLAFRGEHDWIVALDDHERIAGWVREAGGSAEARVVAGVDHDMQRHASRRASFTRRGLGEPTDAVAALLAAWMLRVR